MPLVLGDLHWVDALARDLLEVVARAIIELPVLIVAAYRPLELLRLQTPRIETLEHFIQITLELPGWLSACRSFVVLSSHTASILRQLIEIARANETAVC